LIVTDAGTSRRHDEIEVDYNYDDTDDKSQQQQQQGTPRVERTVSDHWGNKDQDDEDNGAGGQQEQHYRRSRWVENDDAGDSDR
jgi:hypothetical protein